MGFTPGFELLPRRDERLLHEPAAAQGGEASRAAPALPAEKVPFVKGFGSIMAERAVDLVLLGGLFGSPCCSRSTS